MAGPNLDKMNVKQLKDIIEKAQSLISKKETEERQTLLAQMKALAAKQGYDFSELVGVAAMGPGRRGGKRQLKVKYRDPQSGATWTGVGRAPKWAAPYRGNKKKLEEMFGVRG